MKGLDKGTGDISCSLGGKGKFKGILAGNASKSAK